MSQKNKKKRAPKKHLPQKKIQGLSKYVALIPILLIIVSTAVYLLLTPAKKEDKSDIEPKITQETPLPPKQEENRSVTEDKIEKLKEIIAQNKIYDNRTTVLEQKYELSEARDYKESQKDSQTQEPKKDIVKKIPKDSLPKLAIIIDDVAFLSQVRDISRIGLDITLSFMPKTSLHPETPQLAKKREVFYVAYAYGGYELRQRGEDNTKDDRLKR